MCVCTVVCGNIGKLDIAVIPEPLCLFALKVSYLASIVRYGETPETSFNQWAWGLILRLKLDANDHDLQLHWPPVAALPWGSKPTETPTFHPLLKAVRTGLPIGCYLALAMTTLGCT